MRTLAVTGGIGSGKSYVVQIFAALGIPVYDADSRTKDLYDSDEALLSSLKALMGDRLVRDGVLDRRYMADRIFSDMDMLDKVEALVFPAVVRDFYKWRLLQPSRAPFVILESAVYLEKPSLAGMADTVLTVTCPIEMRIARVMDRSGLTREEVQARINNQWPDSMRVRHSDFVIVSDFRHTLLPQVCNVYEKMKKTGNYK